MNGYENERELMYYLEVIWKRKWFIIIFTFLCVAVALVISFLLPSTGEFYAIIQPSKFLNQTKKGQFKEVLLVDSKLIAGQINEGFYNSLISSELNMDIRKLPKFKAENLTDTNLLWVSIIEKDVEKAKLILNSLLKHLKKEFDEKAKFELNETKAQLNSKKKEIHNSAERIGKIYYAKIIKEPTSSFSPVSPKKFTNVFIAGILGLLIFGMLAFLLEYVEKQKLKLKK